MAWLIPPKICLRNVWGYLVGTVGSLLLAASASHWHRLSAFSNVDGDIRTDCSQSLGSRASRHEAIICSNSSQADLSSATDKSSSEPTTGRGGGEFGTGGSVIAVVFGGVGLSFFFRPN